MLKWVVAMVATITNTNRGELNMTDPTRQISYGIATLRDFRVAEVGKKGEVTKMAIGDQIVASPSPRFWGSLCSNYSNQGLSLKLFNLFTHSEVFQRIHDRLSGNGQDMLRYAIETKEGHNSLLAVTNPNKPLISYEGMASTLQRYATVKQEYEGGIVRSTHTPPHMDDIMIGPDKFAHQYVMETPIDGYGKPLIYLSLLRMICSNGAIGYGRAFRSEVNLGTGSDDATFTLERTLDSFNNEDGYAQLRQRFEAAQGSWASIAETHKVYETILKMGNRAMFRDNGTKAPLIEDLFMQRNALIGSSGLTTSVASVGDSPANPVMIKITRAFTALTGDLTAIYNLTHLDALSLKRKAQLPARCSMYDLLNFCTEVSTHYCSESDGRLLQAEVGNFISNNYDLEGTIAERKEFSDWFTGLDTRDVADKLDENLNN